ncbi:MAG: hypothetical protein JW953_15915 [Anaerolineae bacterium]|nr:hypothetical protein [Anaerolineae bacterium]
MVERDDGGPDFSVFKPFTRIEWPIRDYGTNSIVMMDDIGFCNPPQQSYHLPEIDIITLGDSFTTCHAVDPQDTWTSQLADLTGLSTYNLGQGGVGIHEYLQILKKFGLQKSPRIVIMNIYEGNDFRDAWKFYEHRLLVAKGDFQPTPTPSAGVVERYSYAFNLAYSVDKNIQENGLFFAPQTGDSLSEPEPETINFRYSLVFPDQVIPWNLGNTDTDEVDYAKQLYLLKIDAGVFVTVQEALATFVELSQTYNFVPVVTYTPSVHTAYADQVVFDDPALKDLMPWFSQVQQEYLQQMANKQGYIFIDLTPALQAAAQEKGSSDLLYYRYDLHLTPSGHAVIAKVISQALDDLKIITKPDD